MCVDGGKKVCFFSLASDGRGGGEDHQLRYLWRLIGGISWDYFTNSTAPLICYQELTTIISSKIESLLFLFRQQFLDSKVYSVADNPLTSSNVDEKYARFNVEKNNIRGKVIYQD